jgi:hypothetical protein
MHPSDRRLRVNSSKSSASTRDFGEPLIGCDIDRVEFRKVTSLFPSSAMQIVLHGNSSCLMSACVQASKTRRCIFLVTRTHARHHTCVQFDLSTPSTGRFEPSAFRAGFRVVFNSTPAARPHEECVVWELRTDRNASVPLCGVGPVYFGSSTRLFTSFDAIRVENVETPTGDDKIVAFVTPDPSCQGGTPDVCRSSSPAALRLHRAFQLVDALWKATVCRDQAGPIPSGMIYCSSSSTPLRESARPLDAIDRLLLSLSTPLPLVVSIIIGNAFFRQLLNSSGERIGAERVNTQ